MCACTVPAGPVGPVLADTLMLNGGPPGSVRTIPAPVIDCAMAMLALPRHDTARQRVEQMSDLVFMGNRLLCNLVNPSSDNGLVDGTSVLSPSARPPDRRPPSPPIQDLSIRMR